MNLWINWICIIIVGFIAGVFVAAEFSVLKVRPSYLQELSDQGNKTARVTLHLLNKLNDTLSTTQVAITFTGIIMGAIGESTVSETIIRLFSLFHIELAENWLLSAVSVIILTYLEVVLTELVPKSIAIDQPNKTAMLITRPVQGFEKIAYPLVWFMSISAADVLKLLGFTVAQEGEEIYTQAEILGITKAAVKGGTLEPADAAFVSRGFSFNDQQAKDIMIDRTAVTFLDQSDTVQTAYHAYLKTGFTRFPVTEEHDKDRVTGYVYSYDLAKAVQNDNAQTLSELTRPLIKVAETLNIGSIYRRMRQENSPIALVVDEYGGTAGMITDEDITEEIMGDFEDENDPANRKVVHHQDGSDTVSGKITLHDFERLFKTPIPSFSESPSVTLSGYITEQQPHIQAGDTFTVGPFTLEAIRIKNHRIQQFKVTHRKKEEQA
ncbi:hemolysinC family Mg(2+) Co(2+) transport protein [Lactobacillus selangorensis]|uniref:HemolysinC family Mg(2+) Co(2+) transport protein n=1 Tax=Lactobacillus selangorensis TaxID=81857 RepID=A0A0R2FJZ6_9LACO|nr:hemolysin family protein [Lactobacillus selangorensis]KRN28961.1 hemolysinC family Mg(2+) Co(2+) transport protein [Lactobacillus selangorensis]KRN32629.1 hemolysinC family Mg(2+) Co(2+) transport protein [Lactobacillus selangorensis]